MSFELKDLGMIQKGYYKSPVGWLEIVCEGSAVREIHFLEEEPQAGSADGLAQKTITQLKEYFEADRTEFDLPLSPQGTDFQCRVWKELQKIPVGQTTSYLEVAKNTGDPGAVRAVGVANGKNPIPIIIPCHRVIGEDGTLVGYAGGLWRKEWLLRHEGYIKQIPLFAGDQN